MIKILKQYGGFINLLIIKTVKTKKQKVMKTLKRLEKYFITDILLQMRIK